MAYLVAVIFGVVMLVLVGVSTYLATQAKVQAVIFNQDGQFIGIPNIKTRINEEAIVANQLIAYISGVYGVAADATSKEHNITKVVAMTDEVYFNTHVLPIIRNNLLKYKEQQVEVRVTYIKEINGVWNIDFDTYSGANKLDSYTSRISFRQDLNLDTNDKMLNNPLGIFVSSIETGEKLQ